MGGSEQVGEGVTLSGSGVTLRKEFVEDEYTVPTIRFVVDNESDDGKTVAITETVPEGYSVEAIGFHPEYGADHWTCYDDERAEFERDVPPGRTDETVYGVRIDDPSEAAAFMTEPRLVVDGEPVGDVEVADEEGSETEVEKELLDGSETAPTDGVDTDEAEAPGTVPSGNGEMAAPPGPETGTVIERLVEELRRNDVDAEQKEILREQLDLGVPSETKARIDQLGTRVETIAAYADALEEFLDEDGTAQELIDDFETQVQALREDVSSIRQQTGSNATEIADVTDDLGALESSVDDLEGTLDAVADVTDDLEDSLSTTDSHLENVEADLRGAEDRIDDNAERVDDLDGDVATVEGDLEDVTARVSATEGDVETLDAAAAELRTDLDDTDADVEELQDATATNDEAIGTLEDDVEMIEGDVNSVTEDVDELIEWREELGEMFQ